jgi:hypothetical protein
MNDKVKGLIFDKLYRRLGNAEIIPYNNSIWFIDRENEFWFFELNDDGCLWWRYHFFISFFNMFSLSQSDFEPIISSWVEEVLNHKVSTTHHQLMYCNQVEEVLNSKVSTTGSMEYLALYKVEEVLNSKVSTTRKAHHCHGDQVGEVLNHKVSTTNVYGVPPSCQIEEVLNHKVSTTFGSYSGVYSRVRKALNG